MHENAGGGVIHLTKAVVTILHDQKQISVRRHERLCVSIDAIQVVQRGKPTPVMVLCIDCTRGML